MLQVGLKCFSMKMTFDLLDELLNAASFTTACDNPGTLKSMSISSSWVKCCPLTGLPVLVKSVCFRLCLRTCLQDQQTLAHNSGWILVHPQSPPVLVEFLVPSRPNKTSFTISWVNGCSPMGLTVLDNWVFGFGWIRWVSLLLPASSESNSFIQLSL